MFRESSVLFVPMIMIIKNTQKNSATSSSHELMATLRLRVPLSHLNPARMQNVPQQPPGSCKEPPWSPQPQPPVLGTLKACLFASSWIFWSQRCMCPELSLCSHQIKSPGGSEPPLHVLFLRHLQCIYLRETRVGMKRSMWGIKSRLHVSKHSILLSSSSQLGNITVTFFGRYVF